MTTDGPSAPNPLQQELLSLTMRDSSWSFRPLLLYHCLLITGLGSKSLNPLPDEKILDWSKLKEIADDNLKCIESEK